MEAGLPQAGPDLNEEVVPPEANLEGKAFSLSKGCYPGQEVVARMDTYGSVRRRLVGLVIDGANVPPRGAKLFQRRSRGGMGQQRSPFAATAIGHRVRVSATGVHPGRHCARGRHRGRTPQCGRSHPPFLHPHLAGPSTLFVVRTSSVKNL